MPNMSKRLLAFFSNRTSFKEYSWFEADLMHWEMVHDGHKSRLTQRLLFLSRSQILHR